MALSDILNPRNDMPGLDPAMADWIQNQKNQAMASALLTSGRGFAGAMGEGIAASQNAVPTGLSSLLHNIDLQGKLNQSKKQASYEQMVKGIPMNETTIVPQPWMAGNESDLPKIASEMSIQNQEAFNEHFPQKTQPRDLSSVLQDYARTAMSSGMYRPQDIPEAIKSLQPKEPKEFNIPGDVDSFLASNYPYTSTQDRMKALNEFRKPEVKKAFVEWKKSMATPFNIVVPTSNGLQIVDARTGKPGNTIGNKPLTGEMITTNQQIGSLNEAINSFKNSYDQSYVGPIGGRLGKVQENYTGVPDKQAVFYSSLEQVKNGLIYLLSGKQINENEYERILDQLPHRNLPANVFEQRMSRIDKVIEEVQNLRDKNSGGYGVSNNNKTKSDPLGIRK